MTTSLPPISDEELSAALDGEAGPATLARLPGDSAASDRSVQLAAAAEAVRKASGADLPPDTVEKLIATALASAAPVRTSQHRKGPPSWAVAAVVVALGALGLTLVWAGRDSGTDLASAPTTTASADAATLGHLGDAEALSADASSPAPGSEKTSAEPAAILGSDTTEPEVVNLGSYRSGVALREDLAESFPVESVRSSNDSADLPEAAALDRCGEQLLVTLGLPDQPQRIGYAQVGDKSVAVYEFAIESFADGRPTTLVAAVGIDSCDEIVVFER